MSLSWTRPHALQAKSTKQTERASKNEVDGSRRRISPISIGRGPFESSRRALKDARIHDPARRNARKVPEVKIYSNLGL